MNTLTEIRWSNASTFEATGVHAGYRTAPGTTRDLEHVAPYSLEVPTIHRIWWGMLEPGGYIVPHIDKGPWKTRWHYPVEPAGYVWQESTGVLESPELPFPIRHWEPHAVWNPGPNRRVHLIVEFDETPKDVPGPPYELVLCDMIPEMGEVLDVHS